MEIVDLKKLAGITAVHREEPSQPLIDGNEKARIMRERNIRPGTEEWFRLWFSPNYLKN